MGFRIVCHDVQSGLPFDEPTFQIDIRTTQASQLIDAAFANYVAAIQNLDDTFLKELLQDMAGAEASFAACIRFLAASQGQLLQATEALRQAIAILNAPENNGSFSVRREQFFSEINYEALLQSLQQRGATLEGRIFWNIPAQRVREQGETGGLLLLIDTISSLAEALRSFHDELVGLQPVVAQGGLGALSRTPQFDVQAIIPGLNARWTRLEWYGTYVTLMFKEASRLLLVSLHA